MLNERDNAARRETRDFALDLRAAGEEGVIEGFGSVFGQEDSYGDVVVPGAFAASLAEHRAANTMPAMLWQHRQDMPIGVWESMEEDQRGLRVKGRLAMDVAQAREAFALVKAGAISGLSIGFMTKEDEYDPQSGIRTVRAVDLWEVSLVTFPAAKSARVTRVKAADVDQLLKPSDAERWLRDAAPEVSKAAATAFVSRLMRMGEERREAEIATRRAAQAAESLLRSIQS
ncbi:MAG: HK97 family phage prohead protease [Roseomonas sp.]|nr:HK97 family phage prohead protease [Roseomonas sp.]